MRRDRKVEKFNETLPEKIKNIKLLLDNTLVVCYTKVQILDYLERRAVTVQHRSNQNYEGTE